MPLTSGGIDQGPNSPYLHITRFRSSDVDSPDKLIISLSPQDLRSIQSSSVDPYSVQQAEHTTHALVITSPNQAHALSNMPCNQAETDIWRASIRAQNFALLQVTSLAQACARSPDKPFGEGCIGVLACKCLCSLSVHKDERKEEEVRNPCLYTWGVGCEENVVLQEGYV